jgi:hypothetical protein
MSSLAALIRDIEAFCAETQMAETAFGVAALNDGRFIARIRSGTSSPTLKTVDRVRAFMAGERARGAATQHAADCAQTMPAQATRICVTPNANRGEAA